MSSNRIAKVGLVVFSWLVACNELLGIGNDYHLVREGGGAGRAGDGAAAVAGSVGASAGRGGGSGNGGVSGSSGGAVAGQGGETDAGGESNSGGTRAGSSGDTGNAGEGGSIDANGGNSGTGGSALGGTGGSSGATGGQSAGGSSGAGAGQAGFATGGAGSSSVSCDATFAVNGTGFVRAPMSGGACWHGYAFAEADDPLSTVAPATFASCGSPCTLHITGQVGADYASYADLGFNVNEAGGVATSIVPTGSSLRVTFSRTGSYVVRFQLSNGTTNWCTTLTTSPQTIPYASLKTQCWETSGTAYAGEPISRVMLLIPGSTSSTIPYDITLNSVEEL